MSLPIILSLALVAQGQVVPLEKGQPAPFSGQLLDPNVAIDLVQLGDVVTARAAVDIKRAKAEALIERQRADALDKVLTERPKELADCGNALTICHRIVNERRSLWMSPWAWFPLGLAAGVTAGILLEAHALGR